MAFYITRCPECKSTFNASARLLKSGSGKVRCGACLQIFDAVENLVQGPDISDDELDTESVYLGDEPESFLDPSAFLTRNALQEGDSGQEAGEDSDQQPPEPDIPEDTAQQDQAAEAEPADEPGQPDTIVQDDFSFPLVGEQDPLWFEIGKSRGTRADIPSRNRGGDRRSETASEPPASAEKQGAPDAGAGQDAVSNQPGENQHAGSDAGSQARTEPPSATVAPAAEHAAPARPRPEDFQMWMSFSMVHQPIEQEAAESASLPAVATAQAAPAIPPESPTVAPERTPAAEFDVEASVIDQVMNAAEAVDTDDDSKSADARDADEVAGTAEVDARDVSETEEAVTEEAVTDDGATEIAAAPVFEDLLDYDIDEEEPEVLQLGEEEEGTGQSEPRTAEAPRDQAEDESATLVADELREAQSADIETAEIETAEIETADAEETEAEDIHSVLNEDELQEAETVDIETADTEIAADAGDIVAATEDEAPAPAEESVLLQEELLEERVPEDAQSDAAPPLSIEQAEEELQDILAEGMKQYDFEVLATPFDETADTDAAAEPPGQPEEAEAEPPGQPEEAGAEPRRLQEAVEAEQVHPQATEDFSDVEIDFNARSESGQAASTQAQPGEEEKAIEDAAEAPVTDALNTDLFTTTDEVASTAEPGLDSTQTPAKEAVASASTSRSRRKKKETRRAKTRGRGRTDSPRPQATPVAKEESSDDIRARALSTRLDDDEALQTIPRENLAALRKFELPLTLLNAQQSRLGRTIFYSVTTLLLSGLLIGQFLSNNIAVYSQDAGVRPVYEIACRVFSCDLPEYFEIGAIRSEQLDVRSHPTYANGLMINLSFLNTAEFPQPFPVLILSFSSNNRELVAFREFAPTEYLAPDLQSFELMPVMSPVQIALEIVDPGPGAVNYTVGFRHR